MDFTTSLKICVILSMCWDLKVESLQDRHSLQEQRTDPPMMIFFSKDAKSSDTFNLTCMATGLYSKNTKIRILWKDWPVGKGREILPNHDGTYGIKLSAYAHKSQINDYRCEVIHGDQIYTCVIEWPKELDLDKTIQEFGDSQKSDGYPPSIGKWFACVLPALGLVLGLVVLLGFMCVIHLCEKITEKEDTDSDSGFREKSSHSMDRNSLDFEKEGTDSDSGCSEEGSRSTGKNPPNFEKEGTDSDSGCSEEGSRSIGKNPLNFGVPSDKPINQISGMDEMYFLPKDEDQECPYRLLF